MDIFTLAGLAVISAVLCLVIRQYKPEMAMMCGIACGIILLAAAVAMLSPAVDMLSQLTSAAGLDDGYAAVLIKALAVCYITQLASDCCRDAGESAIAGRLELAGRAAVLVISLPVFESIAKLVTDLIGTM